MKACVEIDKKQINAKRWDVLGRGMNLGFEHIGHPQIKVNIRENDNGLVVDIEDGKE